MDSFEDFSVNDLFMAQNVHNLLRLCLRGWVLVILERGDPSSGMRRQSRWQLLPFPVVSVPPFFVMTTE